MEDGTQNITMSLGKAWTQYAIVVVLFFVSAGLARAFDFALLAVAVYLVIGIYMNRTVLRQLIDWHPVHNTVENVSSSKLKQLVFWPISYPALFLKLAVVKHL